MDVEKEHEYWFSDILLINLIIYFW